MFNDPSIFRCLDSLPRESKKIIVDGKFEFTDIKQELSDEWIRERVRKYDNVELIDMPNVPEPRKRDQYLINNESKYLIIIDSDDYIEAVEWDRFFDFIKDLDSGIHDIFIETDKVGGVGSYPRLWVNPKDWRYTMCHNIFKNEKLGMILKSGNSGGKQVPGLLMGTDDDLREKDYLILTSEYQGKMMAFEKPYRAKYRSGDLSVF